jgi:hypothetical protein
MGAYAGGMAKHSLKPNPGRIQSGPQEEPRPQTKDVLRHILVLTLQSKDAAVYESLMEEAVWIQ